MFRTEHPSCRRQKSGAAAGASTLAVLEQFARQRGDLPTATRLAALARARAGRHERKTAAA